MTTIVPAAVGPYGSYDVLLPQHQALLAASAISPEVARGRGYRSAVEKTQLRKAGYNQAQQSLLPALMIHLHAAGSGSGGPSGSQIRPDEPREIRGKLVKYETPAGMGMLLDAHPVIRDRLTDPATPLLITEGVRKADAAISRGMDCLALLGVWNFRGTNDKGGKALLADFEPVAWNNRDVVICFDSDVVDKREVASALRRLIAVLNRRSARVHTALLPSVDGRKVGLDDWLAEDDRRGWREVQELIAATDGEDLFLGDGFSLTDDGNGLRLVRAAGFDFRYCPERGRWLRWVGGRWAWDIGGSIREGAREVARDLPDVGDDQAAHKNKSLSAVGVSNMVRLAQTDERVIVPIDLLDASPYRINTTGGVVDLTTGTLVTDPRELNTKMTHAALGHASRAVRFAQFLDQTFAGDAELVGYVQRLLGHSMFGTVTEHVLPFAHGAGANGKSVLFDVVMGVLGIGDDGYAVQAPSDFLMSKGYAQHPTELARLKGARLVVCQELNAGQAFDEAKVKHLTGGDPIAGRFMRQDFFTFTPTHHLWLVGNHRPAVREGGPAFWRRLREIPFEHVVPDQDQDKHLAARLIATEGDHILAWLVEGAVAAYHDGIGEPQSVITATQGYRMDEDTVARFLAEACEFGNPLQQHNTIRVSELRATYEAWCREAMVEPVGPNPFSRRVVEAGAVSDRNGTARYFKGIRLTLAYQLKK